MTDEPPGTSSFESGPRLYPNKAFKSWKKIGGVSWGNISSRSTFLEFFTSKICKIGYL